MQNYHCDERHQVHIPGSCIIFETLVIVFYLFNLNNIDRKRLYCCLSGQNLYCLIIPPVSQYQHLLYVTSTSVQYLYCTVYVAAICILFCIFLHYTIVVIANILMHVTLHFILYLPVCLYIILSIVAAIC